jgi:hypothetical protein
VPPRVYQAFGDGLDAEVEPFERTGAEQDEVAGLSEDAVVGRAAPTHRSMTVPSACRKRQVE